MKRTILCSMIAISITATDVRAAENPSGVATAKIVAPFLDGQSYLIAHIDLRKVDVTQSLKYLAQMFSLPVVEESARQTMKMGGVRTALLTAKVNEMFIVLRLSDLPRAKPFLIVPVENGGDYHTVAALLFSGNPDGPATAEKKIHGNLRGRGKFEICTRLGNVVFAGERKTLARLKTLKTGPRPQLHSAFTAAGKSAVQIVLVPGVDHRRVIAEMLTQIPAKFGGGSGRDLVQEFRWASLGINMPPKLSLRLTIQSKNAASAKSLHARLVKGLSLIAAIPAVKTKIKSFDKLTRLLTPKLHGNRLSLELNVAGKTARLIVESLVFPIQQARNAASLTTSKNHLKQLALAMHNFHDRSGSFPPHASYSDKGKRLLSWRVFLLPYLEQTELFKQFHLDEPWDSAHNKKLIAKMPAVFADPRVKTKNGKTRYLAPVGTATVFTGKPDGIRIQDIVDGTANTIMIVEADPKFAVVWTKPDDLNIDLKKPRKGLTGGKARGFLVAFCDGSVRVINNAVTTKILRAILTRNGDEVVGDF